MDRGAHSVEVLVTLLALKCALPDAFFMSRGNHESETVNRVHGFYEEVVRKYDARMYTMFGKVLNSLPLAYIVAGRYFVLHGGLCDKSDLRIEDIQRIDRHCVPETGSMMAQLLWSDPGSEPGLHPSHRGEGVLFGPDVTAAFLERNGLKAIVRSHVWEADGYKVDHGGQCVTIFSAPNYTGAPSPAAYINIGADLELRFVQFEAAAYQGKQPKRRPTIPLTY